MMRMPVDTKGAQRSRKLHAGHFAFMRAVVQGLDTRESWNRYLRIEGEHDDARNVSRTIQWIRDEFAAAARRYERFGTARLVTIDASRIPDDEAGVPTLEEFAAEHDMLDFSQAEQLEHYQARYGAATRRQSRRTRLIARQLDALAWLQRLVVQPPQAGDRLASWLHPDLASRLEAAGVLTLRQLVDRINGLGMRWWTGIRAIGAIKGERIMDWLRAHEESIGLAIGAHVRVKRSALRTEELTAVVPPATAIVPLEKLIVPAELDGSEGIHRAPQHLCRIPATNDHEAVLAWVRTKHGHTRRAYLKEAERFMLWAIVQHRKPLSSITPADCEAYREFLADPAPAERWCGPRAREKWGPLWRPFEGPLSRRAQRQAVTILKSLYRFLVDQGYLTVSAWDGVALPKADEARAGSGRRFLLAQWDFIETQLSRLPGTSANHRLRFALHLFHATGLRLGEAVAARVDDLSRTAVVNGGESVPGWTLSVTGKGSRRHAVPLPDSLVAELSGYLAARGLECEPLHARNQGAFLLGKAMDVEERAPWSPASTLRIDAKDGIAAATLYRQLKEFFASCAQALEQTDAGAARRLAKASTHWLRQAQGSGLAAPSVTGETGRAPQRNPEDALSGETGVLVAGEQGQRPAAMRESGAANAPDVQPSGFAQPLSGSRALPG